jgi:hypothetical protein
MIELSIMDHGAGFTEAMHMILAQFEAEDHCEVELCVLPWRLAGAD